MLKIKIDDIIISEDARCFIIAEAGVNHNGDITLARKMIDTAKKSGADAIKFQTYISEEVVTKKATKAPYQKRTTSVNETQYEMIKKLELSFEEFRNLSDYAKQRNLLFLSTPFDFKSVDFLIEIGVPAIKIPSGELNNLPFLKKIGKAKKPVILSTGMAYLGEIETALTTLKKEGTKEIALLHCVTSYPALPEQMNLRAIHTLKCAFNLPVGLSDHTTELSIPWAARGMGASIIEKHFTLDRQMPGPDHKASLDPQQLKDMIVGIRSIETAMGDGQKKPNPCEMQLRKIIRKSIVASMDIPKGDSIISEMLSIKRPGTGIEPKYIELIIGRRARRNILKDEIIGWDQVI